MHAPKHLPLLKRTQRLLYEGGLDLRWGQTRVKKDARASVLLPQTTIAAAQGQSLVLRLVAFCLLIGSEIFTPTNWTMWKTSTIVIKNILSLRQIKSLYNILYVHLVWVQLYLGPYCNDKMNMIYKTIKII